MATGSLVVFEEATQYLKARRIAFLLLSPREQNSGWKIIENAWSGYSPSRWLRDMEEEEPKEACLWVRKKAGNDH